MRVHIVQKGDTLWKIAKQYGIGFDELKRLNAHLANPEYIVPGMEIMLPDTVTPSKTNMTKGQQTAPMTKGQQTAPMTKEQQTAPMPQPKTMEEVKKKQEVKPQPMPQPIEEVVPEVTMPEMKEQPIPTPPQQPMPQPEMPIIFPQPHLQFDFAQQIHTYPQQPQPMPQMMPQPIPIPMPQIQPIFIEQRPMQPIVEKEEKKEEPVPMPMPETHVVYVPCIPQHCYHEPMPCGCSQPVMQPPCGCQEMHYQYQPMTNPCYGHHYQEPVYQEPTYQEPAYQNHDFYEAPQYNVAGAYDTPCETEEKLPDWLLDSSSADSYVLGVSEGQQASEHVQQEPLNNYDDIYRENGAQVADYYTQMNQYNHTGVMPAQHYPTAYDMMPQQVMPQHYSQQMMPQQYMPQSMPCGCNYSYPHFNQHSTYPHFTPWNY